MSKENFSDEVKRDALNMYNGFCCVKNCLEKAVDLHHQLPNTRVNQRKYPLFIQSIFNCAPVGRFHHDNHSQYPELNISEDVAEVYEKFLKDLIVEHGGKID